MKNKILILLVLLVLGGTLVLGGIYFMNGNKDTDSKNNINENDKTSGIVSDEVQYTENDFIRKTEVVLVEEPACTGNGSSLVASINEDGYISISQSGGAVLVNPGKAKYLLNVGKLACDIVELYFITENNELYKVVNEDIHSGKDIEATKVTESKVVEFLGTDVSEMEDGYSSYIKVLLEDESVEHIEYLKTVK